MSISRKNFLRKFLILSVIFTLICVGFFCSSPKDELSDKNVFKNLHDSVAYVGMETCKQCHADIYNTYIETGMGSSFDHATKQKSVGDFTKVHTVYDDELDMYYSPFWKNDTLWLNEFRLDGKDTIHQRIEKINYIIGSGHHTNSHLLERNGYVYQAPITFYTQKQKWDLPPGFEHGFNTRFTRLIGLECMSCHNAYPKFEKGSENKFSFVSNGIDCERCHGPGALHVEEKQKGIIIDTSKYVDYSIVNPGKLSANLQFEICQRCHLQGNAVLEDGKSFFDFKPGMELKQVMSVFLPKYEGADDQFIMASHADRFKMSKCFTESAKNVDNSALRPYKNALTCVTCHNPHVSVKKMGENYFNNTCNSCHDGSEVHKPICNQIITRSIPEKDNCVKCHMPVSGSIDIPHVTIHDHYIRKEAKAMTEIDKSKRFLGLQSINNSHPKPILVAKAYLQQFEKFEPTKNNLLDSALVYLQKAGNEREINLFKDYVYYYFLRNDFENIIRLKEEAEKNKSFQNLLKQKSYDNSDAWTAYRIGEAYSNIMQAEKALIFYELACKLAPYFPEFQNKMGAGLLYKGELAKAEIIFKELIAENSTFAPAYSNLGYLEMLRNNLPKALTYLDKAISINPDYEQALLNKAGTLLALNKNKEAKSLLLKMSKRFPNNPKVKVALEGL
jgi:tetratricopeptide (TPR) repeat protein